MKILLFPLKLIGFLVLFVLGLALRLVGTLITFISSVFGYFMMIIGVILDLGAIIITLIWLFWNSGDVTLTWKEVLLIWVIAAIWSCAWMLGTAFGEWVSGKGEDVCDYALYLISGNRNKGSTVSEPYTGQQTSQQPHYAQSQPDYNSDGNALQQEINQFYASEEKAKALFEELAAIVKDKELETEDISKFAKEHDNITAVTEVIRERIQNQNYDNRDLASFRDKFSQSYTDMEILIRKLEAYLVRIRD